MVQTIMDKENNIFGWKLLSWKSTAFHMYGNNGEYNLKILLKYKSNNSIFVLTKEEYWYILK
jgi:hypothetical protein